MISNNPEEFMRLLEEGEEGAGEGDDNMDEELDEGLKIKNLMIIFDRSAC